MNTDQQQHDDLIWLAFQYVSGEMEATEHAQFEERLSQDLAACEAVAAIANLSIQMRLAACDPVVMPAQHTMVAVSRPARLRNRIALATTLAAICLIFAVVGQESPHELEKETAPTEDVAGLIAGWSNSTSEEPLAETTFFDLDKFELQDNDSTEIPAWMIAAVSLDVAESDADEMMEESVDMKERKL